MLLGGYKCNNAQQLREPTDHTQPTWQNWAKLLNISENVALGLVMSLIGFTHGQL